MSAETSKLGRIRGLDGIRALSVLAVLVYHLGTTGGPQVLSGGFLGVDVFFVLSGFLITSLLLAEAEATGRISLKDFYVRRAKRLLPALYAVLAAVGLVAASLVPEQVARLRGDVFAAITYVTNWWLIDQNSSYFGGATGDKQPLLNHLWSLAVEEQFYVVWPLVIIAVYWFTRGRGDRSRRLLLTIGTGLVVASAALAPLLFDPFEDPSRVYYGTDTRVVAPLLGALLAIAVRPWRYKLLTTRGSLLLTDAAGLLAFVGLGALAAFGSDQSPLLYRGGFFVIAALGAVFVAAVSRPLSLLAVVLEVRPLRWLGERSYGVYLWHWPIFVLIPGAGVLPVVAKFALTGVVSVLSYRFIEQPVRRGMVRQLRRSEGRQRAALALRLTGFAMVAVLVTGAAAMRLSANTATAGGPVDTTADQTLGTIKPTKKPSTGDAPTGSEQPKRPPFTAPIRVGVYGDSQGMTLLLNKPADLSQHLIARNDTIEGCGILLTRITSRSGEKRNLRSACPNWQNAWAERAAAHKPQIALVMLGAWDVFDLTVDGQKIPFGSPDWDARFNDAVGRGLDELKNANAQVALALLPCYRPIQASAGFWPERGDDDRTRHVNELLRAKAQADPQRVFTVEPPGEFCTDPSIGKNTAYRWDGIHFYKQGAALYFRKVIPQLLAIPQPPA